MHPAPPTGQADESTPYRAPRRSSLIADGRRAEAKVYNRAEAELLALAGAEPNDLQLRWVRQAASLQAMMHVLTREASGTRKAAIQRTTAYTAASRQYTALVDRIVRGAPDRKHERQERPEAPDLRVLLGDDADG
jgi:hypothetical protein